MEPKPIFIASTPIEVKQPPRFHRNRLASLFLSGLLWPVLFVFYLFQFDFAHAVTFFPVWIWPIPGILFSFPCWKKNYRKIVVAVIAVWFLFVLLLAEEPYSLVRGLYRSWPASNWEELHSQGQALRIVTFNCLGDGGKTIAQFSAYRPDVILLQESPLPEKVEVLIQEHFPGASYQRGGDSTIIASAGITLVTPEIALPPYTLPVQLRMPNGLELHVISLHLKPPSACADLWSSHCRQEQSASRQNRRAQMQEIVRGLESLPNDAPLLIGGDFNAHGGDAIFRLFRPRLFDAFSEAGQGWGNTMLNDLPLLRFDQVWASSHFRASAVRAHPSLDSDHRYVICDLVIED